MKYFNNHLKYYVVIAVSVILFPKSSIRFYYAFTLLLLIIVLPNSSLPSSSYIAPTNFGTFIYDYNYYITSDTP